MYEKIQMPHIVVHQNIYSKKNTLQAPDGTNAKVENSFRILLWIKDPFVFLVLVLKIILLHN